MILNVFINLHKVEKYLVPLIRNSIFIYVLSLFLSAAVLFLIACVVYSRQESVKCRKLLLNKNLFGIIILIFITLFTLIFTFHNNYETRFYYNNKVREYDAKLTRRKHIIYYDKQMLSYFNKNRSIIKHGKRHRIYFASLKLNNNKSHIMSRPLISKMPLTNYIPETIFLKYNKHSGSLIIEPDTKNIKNEWKHYKGSLDDIITGQTINFPSMSTNYLIPVLQKLPYIIYKAKLSEFSNNYKNIDVYSYHVNKLSDIGTYNSLPLNDVPKYIYLNTKYNISDIKKSISLNRKELNNVQYKKEIMSYRKKRNHIFIKGVATYVNTCNFQIFVQFLVNLILFNALFNICQLSYFISVFIFIKFIYSNKNSKYRCNDIHKVAKAMVNHYDILKLIQNYQFDFWSNFGHIIIYMFSHKYTAYYAKIIVDNYIFKLTPLVIAVMSGMFAMYSNDDTSGIFEILIQYTIPVLSSIQFFRLMMKFYRNK